MFSRHKKQTPLKFEVCITVLSMSDLPAKYKHLRLITTRGAKAVSTKELFAVNQRCQPSGEDGAMKMISTMYKCTKDTSQFEEKTYKLSLVRINPRAMREKEKKIGATFINLADYVNPDPIGVNTEVKLSIKSSDSSTPAQVTVQIKSHWLRNFKGSDEAMSDMSGMSMETSSMASATTCSSLNSVEEEEDQDQEENEEDDDFLGNSMHSRNSSSNPKPKGRRQDDDDEEEEEVEEVEEEPAKARAAGGKGSTLRREGSTPLSPTAQAAVSGDLQALKEALMAAKSEAQWTSEQLKDSEKALAAKETQLKEAQEDIGRLEADLEAALRVQEELMEENERAEQDYQDLLSKVESGASSKQVDQVQLQHLRAEIDRLKEEATALRGERNDLKQALANEQQTIKKAAEEASAGAQATKQISELEDSLQKEKAKAAKFKGWLEKMTEQKAALESELAEVQERLAEEEASSRAKPSSAAATGGADVSKVSDADKDKMTAEMNKMAAEMERISLQLVAASLGHAQAEQDRLESKQQVYKLKETNRKLRERLTQLELLHATQLAHAHDKSHH